MTNGELPLKSSALNPIKWVLLSNLVAGWWNVPSLGSANIAASAKTLNAIPTAAKVSFIWLLFALCSSAFLFNIQTGSERDLDITPGLIYKWQQRYRVVEDKLHPSAERAEQAEIRRLKRELEIARQERDILKKAIRVFSRGES
jgi:hypothetical protein